MALKNKTNMQVASRGSMTNDGLKIRARPCRAASSLDKLLSLPHRFAFSVGIF